MLVIYLQDKDRRGWDGVPRISAAVPNCANIKYKVSWHTL